MFRRVLFLTSLILAGAACSDTPLSTGAPPSPTLSARTASTARERLAQALAITLADPAARSALKARLDISNAPEGKLQFQALVHTDQGGLLANLARAAATTPADLLADLDAARGLELYLPVAAQRAAWNGDANLLVGTIGTDTDQPVAFDLAGGRRLLDRAAPPAIPVLALVPQETDFTHGHPERIMACVDDCGAGKGGGGGTISTSTQMAPAPGLYLVQSHFDDLHESWLKGDPEFEYHVYGVGDNGESIQLACTGEHQTGSYLWDQNGLDWTGSAMLLSDADFNAYQAQHPGAPIRIVAWEDDDESCVDHADVGGISALITAVDNAYKAITSGKVDPTYIRGIKAAPSIFNLVAAIRNIILTSDDMIGNAVEGTITGDAPSGANWVLKTNGTVTAGWFTTLRIQ